jgi:nitrogen fixation protein NifU and related proteins
LPVTERCPMSHNHELNCSFLRHVNLPSNLGSITNPSGRALGVGQCGDSIEVMLQVDGGRITTIRCRPKGCAFTIACTSAMSELAEKRSLEQALEITPDEVEAALGGLPEDHLHCARLAVNTLGEAIADCYRSHVHCLAGRTV